jgi:hypothetical protein
MVMKPPGDAFAPALDGRVYYGSNVAERGVSMLYGGVYRAIVAGGGQGGRVQVTLPSMDVTTWASTCVPPGCRASYQTGQQVWVMFENGKADYPVVVGLAPTSA